MIYLDNTSSAQTIYIPRMEDNSTYVSPYERGVADGKALQKALLASTAITENGIYTRENGWNSVDVNVPTGSTIHNQDKSIASNGVYTHDSGYTGLGTVNVNVPTGHTEEEVQAAYNSGYTSGETHQKSLLISTAITANGTYTRENGYNSINVNVPQTGSSLQTKDVTLSEINETILPDSGYDGMSEVNVDAKGIYDEGYAAAQAAMVATAITANGDYSRVEGYSSINVNVPVLTVQSAKTIEFEDILYQPISSITSFYLSRENEIRSYDNILRTDSTQEGWFGIKDDVKGYYNYQSSQFIPLSALTEGVWYNAGKLSIKKDTAFVYAKGRTVKEIYWNQTKNGYYGGNLPYLYTKDASYDGMKSIIIDGIDDTVSAVTSSAYTYGYTSGETVGKNSMLTAIFEKTLTEVTLPSDVRTLREGVLSDTSGLTAVTLNEGLTTISVNSLAGTHISEIAIPSSVTTLGAGAFNNTYLTSLTIPSSVTNVDINQYNMPYLASLTLDCSYSGKQMTNAFYDCTSLADVNINNTIWPTGVEAYVFRNCAITAITFGSAVTIACADVIKAAYEGKGSGTFYIISNNATAPDLRMAQFVSEMPDMTGTSGVLKIPTWSDYSAWITWLSTGSWTVEYF